MRKIILLTFVLISHLIYAQDFISINTSKPLCVFSFLETAADQPGTSSSYSKYIQEQTKSDPEFDKVVSRYKQINLMPSVEFDGYPDARKPYKNLKDLIWIAASQSADIADLNLRIAGILPHQDHVELINIMKSVLPTFDNLVWNKTYSQRKEIEDKIRPYLPELERLFLSASQFYGAEWDTSVPFVLSLYPIPLELGTTTAIPKGNALICSYLSESEDDYLSVMGVAIHEMCHILYDAQPIKIKKTLDDFFVQSTNPFAKMAYSYIDEGLATVIGNGWAYKEITGTLDTNDWYNDVYINGFAKSMYPTLETYITQQKTIDKNYIDDAIANFELTFPKSLYDINILMNAITIFANTEDEDEINELFSTFLDKVRIRSLGLSTPMNDPKSIEQFHNTSDTKVFVLTSEDLPSISLLKREYPKVNSDIGLVTTGYYALQDEASGTTVVIIKIPTLDSLPSFLDGLLKSEYFTFDTITKI